MKQPFLILLLYLIFTVSCSDTRRQQSNVKLPNGQDKLIRVNKYLVAKDDDRIKAYAKRMGWDMKVTGTGLWYEIYSHGNGIRAGVGKTAVLEYKVSLLDGTLCYTSDSLGLKKFRIGKAEAESGLNEGVEMLREGDKAHFILPPHLAFGVHGDDNRIPMRSIIVYDVILTKLIDAK